MGRAHVVLSAHILRSELTRGERGKIRARVFLSLHALDLGGGGCGGAYPGGREHHFFRFEFRAPTLLNVFPVLQKGHSRIITRGRTAKPEVLVVSLFSPWLIAAPRKFGGTFRFLACESEKWGYPCTEYHRQSWMHFYRCSTILLFCSAVFIFEQRRNGCNWPCFTFFRGRYRMLRILVFPSPFSAAKTRN